MLEYLVARPHQIVTKNALLEAIWPDSYVVDAVLSVTVSQLRDALGDDPREARFIETVHRRGYRWIGSVETEAVEVVGAPERAARAAMAVRAGAPEAASPSEGATPLFGRDAALAELAAATARAAAGRRQLVFVTGEPGIGKTTLLDHFLASPATRSCLVARGQCIDAYGMGEAYMPILEALRQVVQASSDAIGILRSHAPTWLLQLPGLLSPAEHDELQRSLASSTGARMVRELPQALETLATDRTIVLVLEDLHWSDHATVSALAGLALRRSRRSSSSSDLPAGRRDRGAPSDRAGQARARGASAVRRGGTPRTRSECGRGLPLRALRRRGVRSRGDGAPARTDRGQSPLPPERRRGPGAAALAHARGRIVAMLRRSESARGRGPREHACDDRRPPRATAGRDRDAARGRELDRARLREPDARGGDRP